MRKSQPDYVKKIEAQAKKWFSYKIKRVFLKSFAYMLNAEHLDSGPEEKKDANFYFCSYLYNLKKFYEVLCAACKTFLRYTKNYGN